MFVNGSQNMYDQFSQQIRWVMPWVRQEEAEY